MTVVIAADLFSETSISVISNIIVYEDEDIREDGLKILANLVNSSEEMMPKVTTALLASIESGFNHELQQRLRTVGFVRTIWKRGCKFQWEWTISKLTHDPCFQTPRSSVRTTP